MTELRTCPYCGTEFEPYEENQIICTRKSTSCRNQHKSKKRLRGLLGKTAASLKTTAVRKRDKMICQICGIKCVEDPTAKLVNGVTVNHIIRLADGGSWDIENMEVLCRRCHSMMDDTPSDKRSKGKPVTIYTTLASVWPETKVVDATEGLL